MNADEFVEAVIRKAEDSAVVRDDVIEAEFVEEEKGLAVPERALRRPCIILERGIQVALGKVIGDQFMEHFFLNRAYCGRWMWDVRRGVFTNVDALSVYAAAAGVKFSAFMLVDPDNPRVSVVGKGHATLRIEGSKAQTVFPPGCFEIRPEQVPPVVPYILSTKGRRGDRSMQEQTFNDIQRAASERLQEAFPKAQNIRDVIEQEMNLRRENHEVEILSDEEMELLKAYRQWKTTHRAASGVFHWKVPKDPEKKVATYLEEPAVITPETHPRVFDTNDESYG